MATAKTKAPASGKQKNTPPAPPAPVLGAQLRAAREARELSLDTVAEELMIRKYYLESLEEGLYRQLPERVYAVGFVFNYAQLLGLEPDTLVEQFKREAYGGRGAAASRMELSMPTPVSQSMLPNRNTIFIIGAALVVLIISGIIWSTRTPRTAANDIPQPPTVADNTGIDSVPTPDANAPVPDTTAIVSSTGTIKTDNPNALSSNDLPAAPDFAAAIPSTPASADANPPTSVSDAPAQAETAQPATPSAANASTPVAPQGTRILVEALQPSWVEIADADGNILFTNILRLGQALPIPNKAGITLTTGNAAGVQIILDGKKLGPLGARNGEVQRAIALDPDKLGAAAPSR